MAVSNRQGTWGAIAACVGLVSTGAFAQISAVLPAGSISLKNVQGVAKFEGGSIWGPSGSPALPKYTLTLLLPANTDPKSVSVALEGSREELVSGDFDVAPVPAISANGKISWPAGSNVVAGRDLNVYGKNAFYPASFIGDKRLGKLGEFQLLEVDIREYLYNPVSKALRHVLTGNIVVRSSVSAVAAAASQVNPAQSRRLASQVQTMTVNFGTAIGSYKTALSAGATTAATTYMIVTTADILSASNKLGAFADAKIAAGFNVELATATALMRRSAGAWVCQNPTVCDGGWGGGSGDAAAEKLRTWLKANYVSHNIEYALLVGDPRPTTGTLPMKMMWPRFSEAFDRESPSDIYYAELTGNWDLNGDGVYGQEDVDDGVGGLDNFMEIDVGRIPYYGSIADLDKILAKTIRYQNETDKSWRTSVLLPTRIMWDTTQNYFLGEWVKTKVLDPRGWGSYRIYDKDYGVSPNATPTNEANVLDAWKTMPFGMHIFLTHGWPQGASDIFTSPNASQLDDTHPSFVIQATCSNATPEFSDNMSYSLLLNGAIGTLGATRVSWLWTYQDDFSGNDASIPTIGYKFSQYMIRDSMTFGQALSKFRATTSGWLMNLEDFNVYGDPSLSLGRPSPKAPAAPTGLAASAGNQLVTLSWASTQGASSYSVKRATSSAGTFVAVVSGLVATSYADASVVNDSTYYYTVSASNGAGESPNSIVAFATPKTPTSGLRVQYRNGDASVTDNQIKPYFQVVNTGSKTESLAGVKIRYWFTNDNGAGLQVICDWCQIGTANLVFSTGSLVPATATADRYVDVVFGAAAGTLAPGATTGEMQIRLNHVDWSNFSEVGDYSYDATRTSYGINDKVALYGAAGELIAGVEPGIAVPPPAAPSLFDAMAGNGKVMLVWSKVSNATGYNVYRGIVGQAMAKISSLSDTSLVDAAVTNGTTYSYNVKAVNASGESVASPSDTAMPQAVSEVPSAPTIVSAVAGDASATIVWKKVASALTYTLKFSKAMGDTIAVAGLVDTIYTKTALVNGTTYAVVVSATNAVGQGANSAPASVKPVAVAVPSAPTGFKAVAGDANVSLSWDASMGATGYSVERMDASSAWTSIKTLSTLSYVDVSVANGKIYAYRVRATNAAGSGAASDTASAQPTGSVEPCSPASDMTGGQSGTFNTTGSVCKRTAANISGWGCANFAGRDLKVNGVAVACGGALPAKTASGHYYFEVSAGAYSWASIYWW